MSIRCAHTRETRVLPGETRREAEVRVDEPIKPGIAVGAQPRFGEYRVTEEDLAKGGVALDAEVQRVQREISEAWPNLTPEEKQHARRGRGGKSRRH